MKFKGIPINKIFSVPNVISYLIKLIFFIVCIHIICDKVIIDTQNEHKKNSLLGLQVITTNINSEKSKLICLSLDCKYILEKFGNEITSVIENKKEDFIKLVVTPELIDKIYKYPEEARTEIDNVIYVYNNDYYTNLKYKLFFILISLFIIGSFPSHFLLKFIRLYKGNTEQDMLKNQLEISLQRHLTESLHHDMKPSITAISVYVRDIYTKLFPNIQLLDYENINFKDETVQEYLDRGTCVTPELVKHLIKDYESINLAIEKLISLLDIIAKTKHLKVCNGSVSLLDIVENAISGVNISLLKKLEVVYQNRDMLSNYSVGYDMNNGIMMSIIHNLVKNSNEALAKVITVEGKIIDGYYYLYITDDGRGIRDKFNKILPESKWETIFLYGYSTKDENNKNIRIRKTWKHYFSEIINKTLGIEEKYISERGVGLCLNRKLLKSVGGDISVVKTNESGTTFLIKFPYKITRKH